MAPVVRARPRPSPAPDSAAVAAAAPAPLALPDQPRVLIFGDSWVYGSAAIVPTLGFAYRIGESEGWDTVIDGVRGSGYLKPGLDGGTYGERIGALDPALDPDLVIVEGSINDRRLPAAGYREAVTAVWDALQALYPEARIVILGPAPQVLPVEAATARIDADLAELAAARGWWYISPIAEDWITPANYPEMIDTGRRPRPPVDERPRVPREPSRGRSRRHLPRERMSSPTPRSTRSSSRRSAAGSPQRGW